MDLFNKMPNMNKVIDFNNIPEEELFVNDAANGLYYLIRNHFVLINSGLTIEINKLEEILNIIKIEYYKEEHKNYIGYYLNSIITPYSSKVKHIKFDEYTVDRKELSNKIKTIYPDSKFNDICIPVNSDDKTSYSFKEQLVKLIELFNTNKELKFNKLVDYPNNEKLEVPVEFMSTSLHKDSNGNAYGIIPIFNEDNSSDIYKNLDDIFKHSYLDDDKNIHIITRSNLNLLKNFDLIFFLYNPENLNVINYTIIRNVYFLKEKRNANDDIIQKADIFSIQLTAAYVDLYQSNYIKNQIESYLAKVKEEKISIESEKIDYSKSIKIKDDSYNNNLLMTIYFKEKTYMDDYNIPYTIFIPRVIANIKNICNTEDPELIGELSNINDNLTSNFLKTVNKSKNKKYYSEFENCYNWVKYDYLITGTRKVFTVERTILK